MCGEMHELGSLSEKGKLYLLLSKNPNSAIVSFFMVFLQIPATPTGCHHIFIYRFDLLFQLYNIHQEVESWRNARLLVVLGDHSSPLYSNRRVSFGWGRGKPPLPCLPTSSFGPSSATLGCCRVVCKLVGISGQL